MEPPPRTCEPHATYARNMSTMVQIRNVPDEIVAELKVRAAQRRLSLSDFLLEHLRELVATPTLDEVLDRLDARPRRDLGVPAAELLREERDG